MKLALSYKNNKWNCSSYKINKGGMFLATCFYGNKWQWCILNAVCFTSNKVINK